LALYNYDWHYNLIEIKDLLEKVELYNYSKYLIEKVNFNEKLKAGFQKTGEYTGQHGQKVAEKLNEGLDFID